MQCQGGASNRQCFFLDHDVREKSWDFYSQPFSAQGSSSSRMRTFTWNVIMNKSCVCETQIFHRFYFALVKVKKVENLTASVFRKYSGTALLHRAGKNHLIEPPYCGELGLQFVSTVIKEKFTSLVRSVSRETKVTTGKICHQFLCHRYVKSNLFFWYPGCWFLK